MAVGDIYNVLLQGHLSGNQIINSFWYVRDGVSGEPDPATILNDFLTKVVQPIRAIQTTAMTWEAMVIKDLDTAGLVFTFPLSPVEHGTVSSDTLPPFCAWSYLLARRHRTTFNGHKRIAAVPETWVADGVIDSGHDTPIAAVATGIADSITDGELVYDPCIVSQILNGEPRTTPLVNLLSGVEFKGISSQNTRKFGRGS